MTDGTGGPTPTDAEIDAAFAEAEVELDAAAVVAALGEEPGGLARTQAAREHAYALGRCGADELDVARHRDILEDAGFVSGREFDRMWRAGKRRRRAEGGGARAPAPAAAPGSAGSVVHPVEGLLAEDAARAVMAGGPLRFGRDGEFWAYHNGVWVPGEDVVHARVVDMLGNKYRSAHDTNTRAVVRRHVGRIECDPTPEFMNFTNGLLEWRTGRLLPHDPGVLTTVQLAVPWDPDATCPVFSDFLTDVVPADDLLRVWEVVGYLMMPGNPLHTAVMLHGGGRNGKGAWIRTLIALLGRGNVSSVSLRDFSENRYAPADLFGRLANVVSDIDATYIENTAMFKQLTGDDVVRAERKYGQPFNFTCWASMLFSANEIPGSSDASAGWTERWVILPFPTYIGDRVDKTLEPRMQAPGELAGIAVLAVEALRGLMARGAFTSTVSGRAAHAEFVRKSNPVKAWLEERAKTDGWVRRVVAYENYRAWADESGLRPLSRPKFYDRLRQAGVGESKIQGDNGWMIGIVAGRGSLPDDGADLVAPPPAHHGDQRENPLPL